MLRKIKILFRRRRAQPIVKGKTGQKAKVDKSWLVGVCFYLFYLILLFLEFSPWIGWAERGEKFVGAAILSGIMIFLLLGYLNRYKKDVISYGSHLGLFLLVNIFVTYLSWGIWRVSGSYYFLPIPLLGFLLTPFLGVGVSFLGVILVSFVISLLGLPSWDILVYGVVGGTVATLAVSYTHRRMEILKAGLVVGIFSYFTILMQGFLRGGEWRELMNLSFLGLSNGVIWSLFTFGMLPLLEHIFGLVTDARLLELSDINHPLLQKLRKEAPGTFQSSLMTAVLTEAAAEAVGANPLLARVAAYYHDVGKLKNPQYFTENQKLKNNNIHNRINPSLSALVLLNHVKEGVNLAKKHHLPRVVIDIIRQHHGTTLASFFYDKAKKSAGEEKVREEDFRYPGPLPASKEAAILMLADAVEAASRTLEDPSPSRIRNLVERIINEKMEDHQLDKAPLSLKDIHAIKENFIKSLQGIFHTRVEYPSKEAEKK